MTTELEDRPGGPGRRFAGAARRGARPALRHRSGPADRADRRQRSARRPAAAGRDAGRISRPPALESARGAQRRRAAMPVLALSAHGRQLQHAHQPAWPRAGRRLYRAAGLFPPRRRARPGRQFRPLFDDDLQQFLDAAGAVRLLPDRRADRQGSARRPPRRARQFRRSCGCASCAAAWCRRPTITPSTASRSGSRRSASRPPRRSARIARSCAAATAATASGGTDALGARRDHASSDPGLRRGDGVRAAPAACGSGG